MPGYSDCCHNYFTVSVTHTVTHLRFNMHPGECSTRVILTSKVRTFTAPKVCLRVQVEVRGHGLRKWRWIKVLRTAELPMCVCVCVVRWRYCQTASVRGGSEELDNCLHPRGCGSCGPDQWGVVPRLQQRPLRSSSQHDWLDLVSLQTSAMINSVGDH